MDAAKWLSGLAGFLLGGLLVSAPVAAQVKVRKIEYQGWKNSVEIANGQVRVVVVPAIGRIMHYGFADGENILWEDPQHYGKTLKGEPYRDEEGKFAWTNFGGDKVWPNQQSEFAAINGHAWPPDHFFDGGEHQAELLEDGVRLQSAVSQYNGARSVREIRLAAQGTRLSIRQRLEKVQPAAKEELEPLRYTIWNVTQIRPPEQTLYPLNPHSHFDLRFHPFGFQESTAMGNFTIKGDIGIFVPDAEKAQKTGADSDRWLAGIVGNTVIAEFFKRDSTQPYPDGGLSAEVYTCPDYTELELLSPWVRLQVGEALEHPIAWELYRLLAHLKTPEEKRGAAVEWLRTRPW
jgi:hypothetical protein